MNRSIIRKLGIAALVAYPASTLGADQAPDVKGKWIGKDSHHTCGQGRALAEGPRNLGQTSLARKGPGDRYHRAGRPSLLGRDDALGAGEKTDEPFIGQLSGKDNRSFVFADTDGFWNGQLDGDTLSFCYTHTGDKTRSTVVSCTEVKRTR